MSREYKYLDPEKVDQRIAEQEARGELVEDDPSESSEDVLTGTLLDLCQLAEEQGMLEEEVDNALRRVIDARADMVRERFRLHTSD